MLRVLIPCVNISYYTKITTIRVSSIRSLTQSAAIIKNSKNYMKDEFFKNFRKSLLSLGFRNRSTVLRVKFHSRARKIGDAL